MYESYLKIDKYLLKQKSTHFTVNFQFLPYTQPIDDIPNIYYGLRVITDYAVLNI